ncbi:hypothetical protein VB620_07100 [Nodularia harveyana UHCC-0300]|uniref:Uncharacterized protein n=1 Tax=Nodularia harveyana UHCC-0300 TaxID=2974287 RepID=A0ABU5UC56_9CYAN|nr:hypothetical protein [Nodularia harveyana]MEA5581105.1 hypothetical protein [Nodularia harveyana UHCC-0300]
MSELKSLEFSPPKPCYESIAYFDNDKGQKFIIKVSSYDQASVEEYTKNLQAHLEYVSENVTVTSNLATENTFIEEETETDPTETQLQNSLEIVIKANQPLGMEQPKSLSFRLSNLMESVDIDEKEIKFAKIFPAQQGTKITIKVTRGIVSAQLLKDKKPVPRQKIEIAAGDEKHFEIPVNSSDKYSVAITGIAKITSEYEINGNA